MRKAVIEMTDLGKTYQSKENQVDALKNINLRIEEGEIYGIIGLSGAGKSTLVRCMNGLETPDRGRVLVNGQDLLALRPKELRRMRHSIGMIFQNFNLFMQRNVLDNVCFPLETAGVKKGQAREKATQMLEMVGMTEKLRAWPATLSGGQKQRVAIARALVTDPGVLLCDECTSALDPANTRAILSLLRQIHQKLGITIVIITHEMSIVQEICSRAAILHEGSLVEDGPVREIFLKPKSAAAKKLIFPEGMNQEQIYSKRCVRIAFDGRSSYEPVIGQMVLHCQAPVNIMYANTYDLDGKAYGQMLLQLPENEQAVQRILSYLSMHNIVYEEEWLDGE